MIIVAPYPAGSSKMRKNLLQHLVDGSNYPDIQNYELTQHRQKVSFIITISIHLASYLRGLHLSIPTG
jgi:hypothetical protein